MKKSLTVCVVGCGDFARNFVPLFKAHPYVSKVYVCDLLPERAQEYKKMFDVETIDSYEQALERSDVNAIANFTQRHLHGDIVRRALLSGKHVYSAVPMASKVEECQEIVELVKKTGLTYMMGETCIYFPSSMFCREKYAEGAFGRFVYGESQYYHDIEHFPANFKADLTSAGVPPFFYPTHSTAMMLHALDTYVTRVVSFGYQDQEDDLYYKVGVNQWDNVFSNEYSLMQLANGGVARVNECRRIGYKAPSSSIQSFYGTQGSYQFNNAQHLLYSKTPNGVGLENVSDYVNPEAMTAHKAEKDFMLRVANHEWQGNSYSPVQEKERKRLPESYKNLGNGHMASHQLLIDDFCSAAYSGALPTVHAWLAARYTIPGLIAHQSALQHGAALDVPDCGMPE
ncbi:MAG: Gfo/Idh/MocA family oxidoreductase [Eubacteriales bacterium]|nr:Gfo/Idh/MocA family oxidoreductase [Eubacteriales bacterium]